MKSILEIALEYKRKGLSVIPLWSPKELEKDANFQINLKKEFDSVRCFGETDDDIKKRLLIRDSKTPICAWGDFQSRHASEDEIRAWFTSYPDANIGIVTGKISNIVVFDLDGEKAIEYTEKKGGFPNTPKVKTGKGFHIFLKFPGVLESIANSANKNFMLDIRADKGYVVAPPSIHGSGRQYQWHPECSILEIEPQECSEWMIEYLKDPRKDNPKKKKPPVTIAPPVPLQLGRNDKGRVKALLHDRQYRVVGISDDIMHLILNGRTYKYASRSEADMAVISSLVSNGFKDDEIKAIFSYFPIGEKYSQHTNPDQYLDHTINTARKSLGIPPEELENPLIVTKSIYKKTDNFCLNIVNFTEYVCEANYIIYCNDLSSFFKYNGKCYDQVDEKTLNNFCQKALGGLRKLFKPGTMKEFVHFAIGSRLMDQKTETLQHYITFKNGIFDLRDGTLRPHSPEIFTSNLLPYDFDPKAECPRFLQFLDEVFEKDSQKINFVQEAVGYIFHQGMPKPAIFFLLGGGANGKSVFLDLLEELVGEKNTANISLSNIQNDVYIVELLNKMINIRSENANKKLLNSDVLKAIVSGDTVTGKQLYAAPIKFRSYAKHFLAMNELPETDDFSPGMLRRIYIIDFPRTFSEAEMDVNLTQKLKTECAGIFNWALEGYKRLETNAFVFNVPPEMHSIKTNYIEDIDSVAAFLKNHIQSEPGTNPKLQSVYRQYVNFCSNSGYNNIVTKSKFKNKLIKKGIVIENCTKENNQVCLIDQLVVGSEDLRAPIRRHHSW